MKKNSIIEWVLLSIMSTLFLISFFLNFIFYAFYKYEKEKNVILKHENIQIASELRDKYNNSIEEKIAKGDKINYKFVKKVNESGSHSYGENPGNNSTKDLVNIVFGEKSWGEKLNFKDKAEDGKFMAYFFNSKKVNQIIKTEVGFIGVNFAYEGNYGIESDNFGAYWVGYKNFDKEKTMEIKYKKGWNEARIIINGEEINKDKKNDKILYNFKKGENKIEVEFLNNWHTTEFFVSINEVTKNYTLEEVEQYFYKKGIKNYDIWYGGAYESKNNDLTIELFLQMPQEKTLIILSSYDDARWLLNNISENIIGVIYKGINVEIGKNDIPIFKVESLPYKYSKNDISNLNNYFEKELNNSIKGFTTGYGLSSEIIPKEIFIKSNSTEQNK